MLTQDEIIRGTLDKMRHATKLALTLEDEPSPELIKLLKFYVNGYGDYNYDIQSHAFALLVDRFSMSQILQIAPERTDTIKYLVKKIPQLPLGNRRAQFFSDLLDIAWMRTEDRQAFCAEIKSNESPFIEMLAERYRRAIKFDKDFVIDLGELQQLGKINDFPIFEDVDPKKLSRILKPSASSFRESYSYYWEKNYSNIFGRQLNVFVSYLLRHPDPDLRSLGAKIADRKNPDTLQEIADTLAREIDSSAAHLCAERLTDNPSLLADSLALCPVGQEIAYELGRRRASLIFSLNRLPTAIQVSYQLGREETILSDIHHMDRMRDGDIYELVRLFRGVAPTLSAIYSGIPRVLQDAVGTVTGLTPPDDLFLELAPAPQIRFLAKLVPKQAHRDMTRLLTHSESLEDAIAQEEKQRQLRNEIAVIRIRVVQEARNRWSKQAGELRDSRPHLDFREDPYFELFPELNIGERTMLSNIEQTGQVKALWDRYREYQQEVPKENWERVVELLPSDVPLPSEGVLGTYNPVDRRLIIYPGMIYLFSKYINCDPIALRTIALIHECVHAVLIHGSDRDNVWWSEFSKTSIDLHEILATVITERTTETLARPELAELAQHLANRSLYSSAIALLRGSNLNDLLQLIASTRGGFLNGDRKAMLGALARLLNNRLPRSLAKGYINSKIIRKLAARSGAAQNVEKMLEHALLRWWCTQPGPNPNQSLRLDLDALEQAIERIGQKPPEQQIGVGLWPALRLAVDFTTELLSMMPISDAVSKKDTKAHESVSS